MSSTTRMHADSYRWLIFLTMACAYVMVTFHRLCPAVLAVDMMRDLDAGGGLLGVLAAGYFYSYALMQMPAGILADSWGARRTTTLFFGLATLGTFCLGLAPSPAWAIAGRVMTGLGLSMVFVCTLKTLAEWYEPAKYAQMTGYLVGVGGLGSLLATAPLAFVSQLMGWRGTFLAVGAFCAVVTAMLWLVVRDSPADAGFASPKPGPAPQKRVQSPFEGIKHVLTSRWFWALAVWFFLQSGTFFAFAGLWAGPFLRHVHGLDAAQSGQALILVALGMLTGAPLMGHLAGPVLRGRRNALAASSVMLCAIFALLSWRTTAMGLAEVCAILYFFGVFGCASTAVVFTMAKELFPVRLAGTTAGVLNIFPFAGGAIMQPLLGQILESVGRNSQGAFTPEAYSFLFTVLLGVSVVGLLASLALKETYLQPQPE